MLRRRRTARPPGRFADPDAECSGTADDPHDRRGGLRRSRRQVRARVKRKIAAVVDDWFDAAYFGGDWPRTDFGSAYPHFSAGAAKDAKGDAALMSNARLGDRLDGVEATKRRLRVDMLAVKKRAVGVTARFVLGMRLTGEVNRSERVAGSLFLTWRDGGWQVFGYDVQRGKA